MEDSIHLHAKKCFIQAVKNFLETTNAAGLEALASRLAPYRIQAAPPAAIADAPARPVLILVVDESNQYPQLHGDLPEIGLEPFPTSFPEAWDLQLYMNTGEERRVETVTGSDDSGQIRDAVSDGDFPGTISRDSHPDTLQNEIAQHSPAANATNSLAANIETMGTLANPPFYQDMPSHRDRPRPPRVPPQGSARPAVDAVPQDQTAVHVPEPASTPVENPYIRADYAEYLLSNLTRWQSTGIWHQEAFLAPNLRHTEYDRLADAYSCICQLEPRMGDDPIRNRAALIQLYAEYESITQNENRSEGPSRRGRGHASRIVDRLLNEIHPEWATCDEQRKSNLRGKFHNRKRFGKRWALLTQHLGPALLFICSRQLEKMVKNTGVTVQFLEQTSEHITTHCQQVVELLRVLNPLANDLIHNGDYRVHDINTIVQYLWRGHQLPRVSDRVHDSSLAFSAAL